MTAPTLTRTRWEDEAACRPGAPVSPDWWWPDDRHHSDTTAGRALHICLTHCPVRERCAAAAEQNPPAFPVVVGGVRYAICKEVGQRAVRPAKRGPSPHPHGCPYCRQARP